MQTSIPQAQHYASLTWADIEPCFQELAGRAVTAATVEGWLADWTQVANLVAETYSRLWVATTVNTIDAQAEQRLFAFLDHVHPRAQAAEQGLREQLLNSGLQPAGMDVPLRNMRSHSEIYREANLPLLTEENKLSNQYDKIIGAQTVTWQGRERTISQLKPIYLDDDRAVREQAWRLGLTRQLADRDAINALWAKFMGLRRQITANAELPSYRDYRWKAMLRFAYTPGDCEQFHRAIEQVVVPAAQRVYDRRRQRLGVSSLRPWDLYVDPLGRPPLRPFGDVAELDAGIQRMFRRVDPQLGAHYDVMRREALLDLDNRKGKAPGGYCTEFPVAKRPFIFMNAVGLHEDVQTLLHEGGHAFHVFESELLPYAHQREVGLEFAEVASMAMELLAAPYLLADEGGFYTQAEAMRARVEHLEENLLFWPYMAVVDAFQHWVYEHADTATEPANCDAKWAELWGRFMQGVDWSGLDEEMTSGWQRKGHIHQVPFYYIEYGLAQLGAAQVWRNALRNQAGAVAQYRHALSLGGTVPLPELYAAAGARFAFDTAIVGEVVGLIESTIRELEQARA